MEYGYELNSKQVQLLDKLSAIKVSDQFSNRYQQAVYFIYPLIEDMIANYFGGRPINVLEIGCGYGPKVAALSSLTESYIGIELSEESVKRGNNILDRLGVKNAEIRLEQASRIQTVLAEKKYDIYICYAVLEHLTIDERIEVLTQIWHAARDGGVVFVGEAPNLLSPIDLHSSKLPYFHQLPIDMQQLLYERSTHTSWKDRVKSEETLELGFYRNGQHVSFYDFDYSIMPINELSGHIVADSFSLPMLRMDPLRSHEIALLHELSDMKTKRYSQLSHDWEIPRCFSRYWINLVFSHTKVETPLQYPVVKSVPENFPLPRFYDKFANGISSIWGSNDQAWFTNDERDCEYMILCVQQLKSTGVIEVVDEDGSQYEQIDLMREMPIVKEYWNPHLYFRVNISIKKDQRFCVKTQEGHSVSLLYVLLF